MNINPAALVAGTSQAVAKGGTSDDQANQARADQSKQTAPGGKAEGADQLDAGDQTQDRGGDGRQVLDVFEQHSDQQEESTEKEDENAHPPDLGETSTQAGGLDFQA